MFSIRVVSEAQHNQPAKLSNTSQSFLIGKGCIKMRCTFAPLAVIGPSFTCEDSSVLTEALNSRYKHHAYMVAIITEQIICVFEIGPFRLAFSQY